MTVHAAVSLALLLTGSRALEAAEPDVAAIRAHAEFWADDLLEGRDAGSRGYEIAARYAATRLASWGLAPGAGAGYLQEIPFVEARLGESRITVDVPGAAPANLDWKTDYVLSPSPEHARVDLSAPLVFAGFGVDAPELGRRDYAAIDARGKVVVLLSGAPASFPDEQRAHHSSRRMKSEAAARHGAVGVLTVRTRIDSQRAPWERMTLNAGRPTLGWTHPDGRVGGSVPEIRLAATLSDRGAAAVLRGSGLDLAELLAAAAQPDAAGVRPRALPGKVTAVVESAHAVAASPNVVAVLPGSDPERRGEYVVASAHLDHVGIGAEVDGDTIYNGFYDNALGSAVVLELARLAASRAAPKRSLLFLLVTAEEKGLLGSDYFASYPTVPPGGLVANLNVDMPLLRRPLADLVALGAEHSSLGPLAVRAATQHGFVVARDPHPEEVVFVRSDQYSFVRRGVPAINLSAGPSARGGGPEQGQAAEEFLKRHYHRPSDEAALGADWETVGRYTATLDELLRAIADAPERPRWNEGNFFGETFAGPR